MVYKLMAEPRELGTTGNLNKLRKAGRIPVSIYGHGSTNVAASVADLEFSRVLQQAGESSLIEVTLAGKAPVNVLVKEVQRDPVSDRITHIDLYQIRMDEEVKAEVRLVFTNESPAVKELGANLITSMDHFKIECLPKDLPHEISVDLGSLVAIGDSIQVKDIKAPAGVTILDEPDATIASVAAVKEEKVPEGPVETVVAEAVKQGPEAPQPEADAKDKDKGKKEEKK